MAHTNPSDEALRALLGATRTVAMVGASAKPARPSHGVMRALQQKGLRIVPVNPGLAGQTLLGEPVAADLASVEGTVDIVDIFRNPQDALGVVRAAIAEKDRLAIKAVWLQIGVVNETAAEEAAHAGLEVVMDRCLKVDYGRLLG